MAYAVPDHNYDKALKQCQCGWRNDARSPLHWEVQWRNHLDEVKRAAAESEDTSGSVTMVVLMCNDCPIGIYSGMDTAEAARDEYASKNPHRPGHMRRYYHFHEFTLDAPARF